MLVDNGGRITVGETHLPPSQGLSATELDDLRKNATVIVSNEAILGVTSNVAALGLIVDSSARYIDLGDTQTVFTVRSLIIDGTNYTRGGFYRTNDWNGFPTPSVVSNAGAIFLRKTLGTVLTIF